MAYIGQSLTEGTRRAYNYTATASQTTFNAVYTVGAVDVYQNGVLLTPDDYTASTGTTIVLGTAAALDDEITIICHNTFSVADTLTASQGGTFIGDVTFAGAFTSQGIDDNATSTAMTLNSSGNLLVGKTNDADANTGVRIRGDGLIQGTRASADVLSLNRTTSDGAIAKFRKDENEEGSINIDSDGVTYNTQGTASHEYNHLDKDSHVLQRGVIPSSGNWNDNTYRNSVILTQSNNTTSNRPNTPNNGLGFYISSQGMGSTYDAAADERAFQLYFPDGDESGLHYRVRQGSSGWHRWKMGSNDYAFKEGATSFSSAYINVWGTGYDFGTSLDATSSNTGITINETGIYVVDAWQRTLGTDTYIGLAISGNRATLEGRTQGAWGHDHQAASNTWTHSKYVGLINSGEKLTMGPPSTTNANNLSYGGSGFASGITIFRIS